MKKIISALAIVALLFAFVPEKEVKAAGVSGSMSGSSSALAGETIVLSFNVNGTECMGANGQFVYDSSKATVNSVSTPLSGWTAEYNAASGMFIVNDNSVAGVSGSQTILKISVTLASTLTPGESVTFGVSDCLVSYDVLNYLEESVSASHTVTISEPVAATPPENAPAESTPSQSTPSDNTSSNDTPSQSTSSQSTPSQNSTTQDSSNEDSTATNNTETEDSTDATTEEKSEDDKTEVKEPDKEEDTNVSKEITVTKGKAGDKGVWLLVAIILIAMIFTSGLLICLLKKGKDEEEKSVTGDRQHEDK